MAQKEMHQLNVVAPPWKYWTALTSFGEQDDAEQSSNDVTSCRRQRAWQNFNQQDSGSGDPELYSFEDYLTPINSPGSPDCRCPDACSHQSSHFHSHRVGIPDSRDGDGSDHTEVATRTKTSDQLTAAVQRRTPRSTDVSLESLSFNHKMTYFFSNYDVDESSSVRCSYEDSCRTTLQNSPTAIRSAAHLDCLVVPDATDLDAAAGPTTPLYYTTPPLSQIPRRCAIKHKRKLIRSNTLSSNSILKATSTTDRDAGSTTAVDCNPTEKYNSDDLTTQLDARNWSNSTGIHGSLSLPNRLNEDSDGLTTALFQSGLEGPDRPTNVGLSVVSQKSLLVSFFPPNGQTPADITGYSVEWSRFSGFSPLSGNHVVADASETSYEIPDLNTGLVYYVQVRAINARGQGPASLANPSHAVPSDWKDIDCVSVRTNGKRQILDDMYNTIRNTLNDPLRTGSQLLKASPAWKKKVRNTFRNLFTSAPKFHRSTKSGIYLAVVIHHEGRILVTTNDDAIPVIEIDSDYMPTTATLNADLQWMTKISCNWHNVKMLRQLLHKIALCDVNALQFRRNLLQAVLQLQTALEVKDLGQLYHQSTRDPASGAVVLTTVCCLSDSKMVNTNQVKWMSLGKLRKRSSDGNFDLNPMNSPSEEMPPASLNSVLLKASSEMIDYYTGGSVRLLSGLYFGYLKLGCSLDQILVMVDQNQPNTLPNVKVRDNSHVSREEWSLIREWAKLQSRTTRMTEAQEIFVGQLTKACSRLLKKLGLEKSEAKMHRLYNSEVLEFSPDVSMIVILPPTDQICTGPGQKDEILLNCINIPIYTFEMLHMRTYHLDLMRRYSQLSSFLEIEFRIAQQELRMGISEDDTQLAQNRVDVLTDLQQRLEDSWRDMRWIVDMATRARDKKVNCGVSTEHLFM